MCPNGPEKVRSDCSDSEQIRVSMDQKRSGLTDEFRADTCLNGPEKVGDD